MTVLLRTDRDHGSVDVGAEAVVFLGAGRPLQWIGVPRVVLRPGEALVAIELVTLCPEDVRILTGAEPIRGPIVLGHEQVGRVVALAAVRRPRDVEGHRLVVGDRVVWAAGAAGHRYGHDRVERGWELSGGCATHVQLLARTPVMRVPDDAPALAIAAASCGAFSADELRSAVVHAPLLSLTTAVEFPLADAERAFDARARGARVVLRP